MFYQKAEKKYYLHLARTGRLNLYVVGDQALVLCPLFFGEQKNGKQHHFHHALVRQFLIFPANYCNTYHLHELPTRSQLAQKDGLSNTVSSSSCYESIPHYSYPLVLLLKTHFAWFYHLCGFHCHCCLPPHLLPSPITLLQQHWQSNLQFCRKHQVLLHRTLSKFVCRFLSFCFGDVVSQKKKEDVSIPVQMIQILHCYPLVRLCHSQEGMVYYCWNSVVAEKVAEMTLALWVVYDYDVAVRLTMTVIPVAADFFFVHDYVHARQSDLAKLSHPFRMD
mmetsp:Transcript_19149/g.29491  ORF Transcript_19149/g.29491 Transcript_19149/m.29491 type:complete len:278 (-) Transcript_19149:14-847(-)